MRNAAAYAGRHHLALLALFVALGGTSYAIARLPAGSVGTRQLRSGAVTRAKLAKGIRHGLTGKRGAAGATGAAGAAGAPGAKGDTGSTGSTGPVGPTFATTQTAATPASLTTGSETLVDQTITVTRPTRLLVFAKVDVQAAATGPDLDSDVELYDPSGTTKLADTSFDQVEMVNNQQFPTVVEGVLGVVNGSTGQRDAYVAQPGTYRVEFRTSHAGSNVVVSFAYATLTTTETGTADG